MFHQKENYVNFFEHLYSSKELEKIISTFDLKFSKNELKFLERYNFDPIYFVYSFYDYLFKHNSIPNQKEFIKFYMESNIDKLKEGYLKDGMEYSKKYKFNYKVKDLLDYLKWRLMRTYPSYIRDMHFSILVKEKLSSRDVFYNPELDVKKGIDILIDDKYKINLYVSTERSEYYRLKKFSRHTPDESLIDIDLPLSFERSKKVGRFFLYNMSHVEDIVKNINKFEKSMR